MRTKNAMDYQDSVTVDAESKNRPGHFKLFQTTWYAPCKTALEFAAALVMLTVAGPIILIAAFIVRWTSPGPAFYSQTRLGRGGRAYTIYKLRSMRHNCELESGAKWSTSDDDRITSVGRFLRNTHIDELPQLWNVLRGEMSLVGPRPERPEFIPQLAEAIPLYRTRLLVRPGVTGFAQVQLHADTNLESVRRKLAYDLHYVRHCGPWLDLRIVLATAFHIVGVPYELLGKLLRLPRGKDIEQAYERLALQFGHVIIEENEVIEEPVDERITPCIMGVEG